MNDGDAIMQAKASLAARLMQWRLPEAHAKAGEFIDDMVRQGWKPHPKGLRRPPTISEECPVHIGEWRDFCRCCVSDRKAAADLLEHGPRLTVEEAKAMARDAIRTTPQPAQVAGAEIEESL